ncbi:MAG TPA: MmcQ/YjbR family DNA-binding protein [Caulobacteraceae bacterium]|nr:MmcQ/YjbR family DNA-binding protein [Caulobacteraceae bacterium]
MTPEAFGAACRALPGVTMVVQWGDSQVYKVGGRVFALLGRDGSCIFRATDIAYAALLETGRARRAPYFSAGWPRFEDVRELDGAELADWLKTAHGLIAAKLTRAQRRDLGI